MERKIIRIGIQWTIHIFDFLLFSFLQANHRLTTKLQRRIYGHATDVAIRPLNEDKAVQAAADLLGELFVFSVMLSLGP